MDIRNPTQLSYKKSKHIEDIYNSAWAPKSTISSQKAPSPSTYLFTIWDLPKEMKSSVIKSYLSFFGTSTILAWQQNFRTKAAYIKILPSTAEQREKSLKEGWSIHLEHGKTYRTTPGKFDITEVEGRNNYKVTENLNGKNTNNSVFYYKRGNSIMSKKNNNNKRPLIETERVKEENRAKRTLTEKSSRTRNGTAIITEDREDSLINNVLRAQSNTRRPLRSTQNKFATGSNRIDLGKKKGKQNEQEI
ncbi:2147_t:CDS:2, partial [Gigaspora rosea]